MNDLVPIDAIEKAPAPVVKPDAIDKNTNPLTGRDERFAQELGSIGQYIGGGREKAGNIAYVVVIASIVILVGLVIAIAFIDNVEAQKSLDRLTSGLLSLVTGALGYLFGASKKD